MDDPNVGLVRTLIKNVADKPDKILNKLGNIYGNIQSMGLYFAALAWATVIFTPAPAEPIHRLGFLFAMITALCSALTAFTAQENLVRLTGQPAKVIAGIINDHWAMFQAPELFLAWSLFVGLFSMMWLLFFLLPFYLYIMTLVILVVLGGSVLIVSIFMAMYVNPAPPSYKPLNSTKSLF